MVTRGNVAIYCYNALTAKMWDVYESTNGQLTSSKVKDTILSKYFSDFVNEAGDMKLFEDVKVVLSGATTSAIGASQVKISSENYGTSSEPAYIAQLIDAEKAPRKDKELVTYKDGDAVVAYVPSEVANIANLAGKTVDVIFGKNNVVAYLVVTDDTTEAAYVTAWDSTEKEIEIDGTVYELANRITINVFNYPIEVPNADGVTSNLTAAAGVIDTLLKTVTGETDVTKFEKNITRNVIAETTLNPDDEIESINFQFSFDGYSIATVESTPSTIAIKEYIIEKISSKNVITEEGGSATEDDLEKLEKEDDPRVIRNGEVATVYDIEVGDVVTEVVHGTDVVTLIVTSNIVEGLIKNYTAKTNVFTVDDEKLVVSVNTANVLYNTDGEVDNYQKDTPSNVKGYFEDEDATLYLNFAGEVVAVVAETEATGTVLGVVTNDYDSASNKELMEDSNEVEYAKIKILTADGNNKVYKIYNDNTNKNVSDDTDYVAFSQNDVVSFSANADRVIKASDIEEVKTTETYNFDSTEDIEVVKYAAASKPTVDVNKEYIGEKRFTTSTKVINYNKNEIVTNFDALVVGSTFVTYSNDLYVFAKGNKIVYIVGSIANYGTSTDKYGILVETGVNPDDDGADYIATILVDGVEETFECSVDLIEDFEIGDMIAFTVSDNEINYTTSVATEKANVVTAKTLLDAVKAAKLPTLAASADEAAKTSARTNYATAYGTLNNQNSALDLSLQTSLTDLGTTIADSVTAVADINAEIIKLNKKVDAVVEKANENLLAKQAAVTAKAPSLVVAKDFVEDIEKIGDDTDIPSTNISSTYFHAVIGEDADYIKVTEIDEDTIIFENKGAQVAFLAEDYIIYSLADGVEVDSISEDDYILLVDYDTTDEEYGIVIIVK